MESELFCIKQFLMIRFPVKTFSVFFTAVNSAFHGSIYSDIFLNFGLLASVC